MGISWQELIVVLLIVLVLFGPKRLPELGSSLGRGMRGFRESLAGRDSTPTAATVAAQQELPTAERAVPVAVEVVDTPADERR